MEVNGQHFDPGPFNLAKESRHVVNTPLGGLQRRSGLTKTNHCKLCFKFTNSFHNTLGGSRNRNCWSRQARVLWIRNSEVVRNFVFARVGCEFCPGIRVTWRILIVVVTTDHLLRQAVHFGIRNYPTFHRPADCGTEKLLLFLSPSVCGSTLLSQIPSTVSNTGPWALRLKQSNVDLVVSP